MNKRKAVIFYFPYRGVGGVSTLFLRLAREMADSYNVYVADYSNGYMAQNRGCNINLIEVDNDPQFPRDATIVFQAFLPWRFPFVEKVSPNTKVLFWGLHPKNFDPSILNESNKNAAYSRLARLINGFAISRKRKIINLLSYLLSRNALVFQDKESIRSINSMFSLELPYSTYMPVPLAGVSFRKQGLHQDVTTFSWIGRVCDFKYTILIHVIERLAAVSKTLGSIKLLIVGDGEYIEDVRFSASRMESEGYKIEFLGDMKEDELPLFLVNRVDFLFAMGTSAIEGARVGVPVLLTDYSYSPVVGIYKFKFFHENSEYCLGEEISSNHFESTSSLESVIHSAISDYHQKSDDSFQYWQRNFSLDSILQKFICQVDGTKATMRELSEIRAFDPDILGYFIRSLLVLFRPSLRAEGIGFKNDR